MKSYYFWAMSNMIAGNNIREMSDEIVQCPNDISGLCGVNGQFTLLPKPDDDARIITKEEADKMAN